MRGDSLLPADLERGGEHDSWTRNNNKAKAEIRHYHLMARSAAQEPADKAAGPPVTRGLSRAAKRRVAPLTLVGAAALAMVLVLAAFGMMRGGRAGRAASSDDDFTVEASSTVRAPEETVPDTVRHHPRSSRSRVPSGTAAGAMAAMEAAMEESTITDLSTRSSRLGAMHHSLMAMVADDVELSRTVDPVALKAGKAEHITTVVRHSKHSVTKAVERIRMHQHVSLCFVVDTTSSMVAHIPAVKECVVDVARQVQSSGCVVSGFAFVGYKDWADGTNHFEVLSFTTSLDEFTRFVGSVSAAGGGDPPEDVLGGLQKASQLVWPAGSASRILLHICDAPPHGRQFHATPLGDDYPDGHPTDPTVKDLLARFKQLSVTLFFGKITQHTDLMLREFNKHLESDIMVFDVAERSGVNLASTVAAAATASIMETVGAVSAMATARMVPEKRSFKIDPREPDFATLPSQTCSIATYELPTIAHIIAYNDCEQKGKKTTIQIAPNSFDKGAERLAYYGRQLFYASSDRPSSAASSGSSAGSSAATHDEVILKEFIRLPSKPELDRSWYMVSLESQTVAAKLAFEFNEKVAGVDATRCKIKFLMAKVACFAPARGGEKRYMMLEKRFRDAVTMVFWFSS